MLNHASNVLINASNVLNMLATS